MSLTIIIVTHNSGHVIEKCISSLGSLKNNVLVIDNNSADDTTMRVKQASVQLLQNRANVGFGRAANRGAQKASGQILCFLNPDCETSTDFFSEGISALEGCPKRCVVPGVIRHQNSVTDGRQFGYTRRKLLWDIIQTNYGETRFTKWIKKRDRFHDTSWTWPLGTCLLIWKDFFLSLNGFDERYFLYCEDVDLGYRIWKAGGEIYPITCEVMHTIQDSSSISRLDKRRLLNNGRITYGNLHYGRMFAFCMRSVVIASKVFRFSRGIFSGVFR